MSEFRSAPESRVVTALRGLLEWAERYRSGDPSLDTEEWYIARDYARVVLADEEIVRANVERRAVMTYTRMVSHPCESVAKGRGACLAKSSDWNAPMCPRCTAVLLAKDIALTTEPENPATPN